MIRAALMLALLCSAAMPALAQSRDADTRAGSDSGSDVRGFAGDGGEGLPEVVPVVSTLRPVARPAIAAPVAARRIDFRLLWQTGIYQ